MPSATAVSRPHSRAAERRLRAATLRSQSATCHGRPPPWGRLGVVVDGHELGLAGVGHRCGPPSGRKQRESRGEKPREKKRRRRRRRTEEDGEEKRPGPADVILPGHLSAGTAATVGHPVDELQEDAGR